jgi:hypothetical protein
MKVFISWSGEHSHQVAVILRDWLPFVINEVEPYMSTEDIEKGARWSADIAANLESTSVGIICVTRENFERPWINFEAGALSKAVTTSRVIPFLVDLPNSDLEGPLTQFQTTLKNKEDVHKLLKTINAGSDRPLSDTLLSGALEMWWPTPEERLSEVQVATAPAGRRDTHDMIQELLETSRLIQRQVAVTSDIIPRLVTLSAEEVERIFRREEPRNPRRSYISTQSSYPAPRRDEVLEQLTLGIKQSGLEVTGADSQAKVIYIRGEGISRQDAATLAAKYGYQTDWSDAP